MAAFRDINDPIEVAQRGGFNLPEHLQRDNFPGKTIPEWLEIIRPLVAQNTPELQSVAWKDNQPLNAALQYHQPSSGGALMGGNQVAPRPILPHPNQVAPRPVLPHPNQAQLLADAIDKTNAKRQAFQQQGGNSRYLAAKDKVALAKRIMGPHPSLSGVSPPPKPPPNERPFPAAQTVGRHRGMDRQSVEQSPLLPDDLWKSPEILPAALGPQPARLANENPPTILPKPEGIQLSSGMSREEAVPYPSIPMSAETVPNQSVDINVPMAEFEAAIAAQSDAPVAPILPRADTTDAPAATDTAQVATILPPADGTVAATDADTVELAQAHRQAQANAVALNKKLSGESTAPAPEAVPVAAVETAAIEPAAATTFHEDHYEALQEGQSGEPADVPSIDETPDADQFLGSQMARRLRPYIKGAGIDSTSVVAKTDPSADPKTATVVGTASTKRATAPLQKAINEELARLKASTVKDPDSTMPFWNWLSDLSAGMRAAAKAGDSGMGALAAGFDNVRKGAKERAATALAGRTAAIKNISELAGAMEDLASITGAGDFSGFGSAAGQFFKTPNLPRSGPVTKTMSTNAGLNLDLVRNDYTYTTDKQNNVTVKTIKRDTLENTRGWELDPETKLPKGKPITFVKGSEKYNNAIKDGTHTFTDPDDIETIANDKEMKAILGKNYDAWKNKGSIIFVTKNAGVYKSLRIQNLPPGKWVNMYNRETNLTTMVDSSYPADVKQAQENGYNTIIKYQANTPTRGRASVLRTSNSAAKQSMALVDKLVAEEDRRRAAGEVPLFGAVGGVVRTYQNFTELASDIGRSLPIVRWMGRSAAQHDYNFGMTPEAQDNFDVMAAKLPIFKTMLVYALAKARKQDNSRLNQHDVALARKDIDKLGVLTSSRQIREGLLAVKTQFQGVIDRNTEELDLIVGTKPPPKQKPKGANYDAVVQQLKQAKADNHPNLETFMKRTNEIYGDGTAERILGPK